MASVRSIVFVCLHGAAKSVIAATYLNHLSTERGLNIRAAAAGVEPEPEVPPQVCEGLLREGFDVRHYHPRRVTPEELAAAWRVVSFGCDLGEVASTSLAVERWDDVPLVSDGSSRPATPSRNACKSYWMDLGTQNPHIRTDLMGRDPCRTNTQSWGECRPSSKAP
jgi:arsenate reductase (thioredoxin)